jgi:serine/threonine-protein kinase
VTVELSIGQTLVDRYRIEERLGSGAMGVVYRARHTKLARSFAIKVLHANLTANQKLRKRFQREAETASTLRHRNVVGVVDIGESDNLLFLVMELAEGTPLAYLMPEAPFPPSRVIEFARQLCDGLQHAHDAGLIHRDFKPENVIVERDGSGNQTLRIIDFGIAVLRDRAGTERERLTTEGIVLGTPHYMSPEHASGEEVDHRIDLFALGVICFEMMTGKMPFDGDGVDVARSNLMYDPPAMAARVPFLNVDPLLEAFTRKLMARDRDDRFASAKAARAVLDLIATDRDAAARALGLEDPIEDPMMTPLPLSPSTRNLVAMPAVPRARTRPPSTLEPINIEVEPPSTEALYPVKRNRRLLWGAAAALLAVTTIVAVAMTRTHEAEAIAAPEIDDEPVAIAIREPARVSEPPPPPPPIAETIAPPPPPIVKPKITQQAPTTVQETPSESPTAAHVAALYGSVGRSLGHLQQTKGSDATIDLWPRFRHIRINDAITTAESRVTTQSALRKLQKDIDARR